MKLIGFSALAFLAFAVSSPAQAQDQCRDVLRDGVYKYETYKNDSYFNQIVYSRFLRSDYRSAREDRSGGFNVPVGEILIGGNFSESEYNERQSQIDRTYFSQINASREIDVALMSGDDAVLGAWTSCMTQNGGGLAVRFDPVSPTKVFMIIEYFNQGTRNSDRLRNNVVLPPNVRITAGRGCLRTGGGSVYVNGKQCIAQLELPSALTTMPVVVNARNSVATAWLPARIQLTRQTNPYPFTSAHRLYKWAHKTDHFPLKGEVALSAEEIAAGWMFIPDTASVTIHEISYNNRRNNCHSPVKTPSYTRFQYGYTIYAGNRRRKDGHMECDVTPYILMRRDVWTAMPETPVEGLMATPEKSIEDVQNRRSIFR